MVYQEGSIIEEKIKRICNSFMGVSYLVSLDNLNDDYDQAYKAKFKSKDVIRQTK